MKKLKFHTMKSPVGILKLIANDKCLLAILWENERLNRVKLDDMVASGNHPILLETIKQLQEYFSGQRQAFNLPLEAKGTEFQRTVWRVLSEIPFGATWTYKQVAQKINRPSATRAVGAAIGRNPHSIVIPCHRVIGVSGSLTGFAGGLDRKARLLDLEACD